MTNESVGLERGAARCALEIEWVEAKRREIERAARDRARGSSPTRRVAAIADAATSARQLELRLAGFENAPNRSAGSSVSPRREIELICSALLATDVHTLIAMRESESENEAAPDSDPPPASQNQTPTMEWRGMVGSAAQVAFAYARRARFDAAMALTPPEHGFSAPDRDATVRLLRAALPPLHAIPGDIIAARVASSPVRWRPQTPPPTDHEWNALQRSLRTLLEAMHESESSSPASATPS